MFQSKVTRAGVIAVMAFALLNGASASANETSVSDFGNNESSASAGFDSTKG